MCIFQHSAKNSNFNVMFVNQNQMELNRFIYKSICHHKKPTNKELIFQKSNINKYIYIYMHKAESFGKASDWN